MSPARTHDSECPIRELERMAAITDGRGSRLMGATPTFSSVPAALEHPSANARGPGMRKAPVWRYRADITASGPSAPAEWGDPAAPLVYVSFGSVAGSLGRFDALYPAILAVLADLPLRVLITTGDGYN